MSNIFTKIADLARAVAGKPPVASKDRGYRSRRRCFFKNGR